MSAGMSESPQLLANVEFDIVKKGYDPEQVDNYLHLIDDQVGQLKDTATRAVEQAEVAHARAAEAQREKVAYLAEAQQAKADLEQALSSSAGGGEPEDADGTEALKKMLLLAQRTADNHVEEAQASAKNIVADARTKSAEIVAGAETRAERLLIEAQKVADELVRERSERIAGTVAELERRRDLLRADSEVLERYLTEHRQRLQEGVMALAALLNDGSGLRVDPVPDLVDPDTAPPVSAESATRVANMDVPPAREKDPVVNPALPSSSSIRVSTARSTGERTSGTSRPDIEEVRRQQRPRAKSDPTAPTAPTDGSPTVVRVTGATTTAERPGRTDASTQSSAVKIPELLEAPSGIRGRIDPDGGPPTQQINAAEQHAILGDSGGAELGRSDSPIPPVDPMTDEAMTRFFDDDLDDDGKPRRFRRK